MIRSTYLIGSLRNKELPLVAEALRKTGIEVFDAWFAAGPEADDCWRAYEQRQDHTYAEALEGYAARHVFDSDEFHLHRMQSGVLVLPAGKSGHLELGYIVGQGKPAWILCDHTPDRYDVMAQFATVCLGIEELVKSLLAYPAPRYGYVVHLHASEAMWLAGLLEGEGAFVCDSLNRKARPRPRIALMMTDKDIMQKAARLLDSKLFGPYYRKQNGKDKKPVWRVEMTGLKAAEYMRVLKPYMGTRRQARITAILDTWDPHQYRLWRAKAVPQVALGDKHTIGMIDLSRFQDSEVIR